MALPIAGLLRSLPPAAERGRLSHGRRPHGLRWRRRGLLAGAIWALLTGNLFVRVLLAFLPVARRPGSGPREPAPGIREAGGLPGRRQALLGGSCLWSSCGNAGVARALASTAEERQTAKVFRETTPGVVSVARSRRPGERRRRETADEALLPPTVGSGFVWDAEHVVTNFHVVKDVGPGNLSVIFSQPDSPASDVAPLREVVPAQVIGSDPATDTAVLRVLWPENTSRASRVGVRPLARGNSSQLEVGQIVYAIGNPFGLDHSMSRGIISGISRVLDIGERPIRGCIQTDASINPGNSGGPLLDSQGRVIGVNTAILTQSGTSSGVGLAIPVDLIRKNVEDIIKQGFVRRAFLGITFAPDEVSEGLQLPGVVVMGVVPGSPAEEAGVKPMRKGALGDVVVGLDGSPVKSGVDLFRLLDRHAPGDAVSFSVQRPKRGEEEGVDELELLVTLGTKKPK